MWAGVVAGMVAIGALFAALSVSLSRFIGVVLPVADLLLMPCSGPFLVGVFAFSLTIGDVVDQLVFFLAFGIGFGLPLFVLGLLGQARGRDLARLLVRYERPLQLLVGVALVAVGLWDLAVNLPALLG